MMAHCFPLSNIEILSIAIHEFVKYC
jgi:hypothetical protein